MKTKFLLVISFLYIIGFTLWSLSQEPHIFSKININKPNNFIANPNFDNDDDDLDIDDIDDADDIMFPYGDNDNNDIDIDNNDATNSDDDIDIDNNDATNSDDDIDIDNNDAINSDDDIDIDYNDTINSDDNIDIDYNDAINSDDNIDIDYNDATNSDDDNDDSIVNIDIDDDITDQYMKDIDAVLEWDQVKAAYIRQEFILFKKLSNNYRKKYPEKNTEELNRIDKEISVYLSCLEPQSLNIEIHRWQEFLKSYPRSQMAEIAKEKLKSLNDVSGRNTNEQNDLNDSQQTQYVNQQLQIATQMEDNNYYQNALEIYQATEKYANVGQKYIIYGKIDECKRKENIYNRNVAEKAFFDENYFVGLSAVNKALANSPDSAYLKELKSRIVQKMIVNNKEVYDTNDENAILDSFLNTQLEWDQVKAAYFNKDFVLFQKLSSYYKEKHPGKNIENLNSIEKEVNLYLSCTKQKNPKSQIYRWEEFLNSYPQSHLAKTVQEKLIFTKGKFLFLLSRKNRQKYFERAQATDEIIKLVELAIAGWNIKERKQSLSILEKTIHLSLNTQVKKEIISLTYYLYANFIFWHMKNQELDQINSLRKKIVTVTGNAIDYLFEAWEKKYTPALLQSIVEQYDIAKQMEEKEQWSEAIDIYKNLTMQVSYEKENLDNKITFLSQKFVKQQLEVASQVYDYEKALEIYKVTEKYADKEQKSIIDTRIKEWKKREYLHNRDLAEKAFFEKNYLLCLSSINKALTFSPKNIYLLELKNLIIERVYKIHESRIVSLINQEKLTEAENYIAKIYDKHSPEEKYSEQISKYEKYLELYPQIIAAHENEEYTKCLELAELGLSYYKDNAKVNKIYQFVLQETNNSGTYTKEALQAIQNRNITEIQLAIEKIKKSTNRKISELENIERTWFLGMAKKHGNKLIEDLTIAHEFQQKKIWILDMSSNSWQSLSPAKKIELAKDYQKAYAIQEHTEVEKEFYHNNVPITMMFVPPGKFMMGSSFENDPERFNDETHHPVIINTPFWISKYETTIKQWMDVTGKVVEGVDEKSYNYPVSGMSWRDIDYYFLKRNKELFRLPTEAEWEYACRSGSTTPFYWGDESQIGDYAWYYDNTEKIKESFAHNVGSKKPNAWDIHDMSGNLYEWCSDWFSLYSPELQINPEGPKEGKQKVYRGGLWFHEAKYCRSSTRVSYYPDYRGNYIGFRLYRSHVDNSILLAKMESTTSSVIEKIIKKVVEKNLDIPIKLVETSGIDVGFNLESGKLDVYPDLWLPNDENIFKEYVENKKVLNARCSYHNAAQGFYIPAYTAKNYNIYSLEDLKKNLHLFDITNDGIGDIWCGDPSWGTTAINKIKIKSYGIELNILPLQEKDILKKIKELNQKVLPFIVYHRETNPTGEWYDLVRIKEPDYDPAKWDFNEEKIEEARITCESPNSSSYLIVSEKLKDKHPKAYRFFMNWYFPMGELKKLVAQLRNSSTRVTDEESVDQQNIEIENIIEKWIEQNPQIVSDWLRNTE